MSREKLLSTLKIVASVILLTVSAVIFVFSATSNKEQPKQVTQKTPQQIANSCASITYNLITNDEASKRGVSLSYWCIGDISTQQNACPGNGTSTQPAGSINNGTVTISGCSGQADRCGGFHINKAEGCVISDASGKICAKNGSTGSITITVDCPTATPTPNATGRLIPTPTPCAFQPAGTYCDTFSPPDVLASNGKPSLCQTFKIDRNVCTAEERYTPQGGNCCTTANASKTSLATAISPTPSTTLLALVKTVTPTQTPTTTPTRTPTPIPTKTPTPTPTSSLSALSKSTRAADISLTPIPSSSPTPTPTLPPLLTASSTPTPTSSALAYNATLSSPTPTTLATPTPTVYSVTTTIVPTLPSAGRPPSWILLAAPLLLLVIGFVF